MFSWIKRQFSRWFSKEQTSTEFPTTFEELKKQALQEKHKNELEITWNKRPHFWRNWFYWKESDLPKQQLNKMKLWGEAKDRKIESIIGRSAALFISFRNWFYNKKYPALHYEFTGGNNCPTCGLIDTTMTLLQRTSFWLGGTFAAVWYIVYYSSITLALWPTLIWSTMHIGYPLLVWAKESFSWLRSERKRISLTKNQTNSLRTLDPAAISDHITAHAETLQTRALGEQSPYGQWKQRFESMKARYSFIIGTLEEIKKKLGESDVDANAIEQAKQSRDRVDACLNKLDTAKQHIIEAFGAMTAHIPTVEYHIKRRIALEQLTALDEELATGEEAVAQIVHEAENLLTGEITKLTQALDASTTHALALPAHNPSETDITHAMKTVANYEQLVHGHLQQLTEQFPEPETVTS